MPPSDRHALVMKSTVPVGTGAAIKRDLRRAGQGGLPLRLLPRVPQGGHGARRLPAARPRRDRRRRRLGRRRGRRPLPAAADRRARRAGRGELVRTDIASAEMVKLAANAFLATKITFINEIANVCEETGADVHRGRPRDGPRRPHRPEVPAGGHRLRRVRVSSARRRCSCAGSGARDCCRSRSCSTISASTCIPTPALTGQLEPVGDRGAALARPGQPRRSGCPSARSPAGATRAI